MPDVADAADERCHIIAAMLADAIQRLLIDA